MSQCCMSFPDDTRFLSVSSHAACSSNFNYGYPKRSVLILSCSSLPTVRILPREMISKLNLFSYSANHKTQIEVNVESLTWESNNQSVSSSYIVKKTSPTINVVFSTGYLNNLRAISDSIIRNKWNPETQVFIQQLNVFVTYMCTLPNNKYMYRHLISKVVGTSELLGEKMLQVGLS